MFDQDPVRFELMYQLGAFPTESSGHVSEYLPYFRTHPDVVQRWWQGVHRRVRLLCSQLADMAPRERRDAARGARRYEEFEMERGGEYPSHIVEAMTSGKPTTVYVTH